MIGLVLSALLAFICERGEYARILILLLSILVVVFIFVVRIGLKLRVDAPAGSSRFEIIAIIT